MPGIRFTAHLAAIGPPHEMTVEGATVRAALEAVFVHYPRLKGYILDDQMRVRRHIVVFVDGERCANEAALQKPVTENSAIFVLQALSGG